MTGLSPASTRRLGRTALQVSAMGFGTAALGGLYEAVDEHTAQAAVQRAVDLGVRLFDTAPLYGHGLAERRLGDALRAAAERSADSAVGGAPLVISTKVGRLLRADAPADPSSIFRGVPQVNPVFDFSADGVRRSLEESLVRLGLDRIDIVYLHDPDDHFEQALGEALPVLRQWRAEGVVGAIGAGMNQSAMLTRFVTDGDIDCVLLAGRYTLLDQTALEDLLPACLAMDVAVVIGGVFNSGVLANPLPGAPYDYIPAPDDVLARASRLAAVCTTFNVPLRAAALQFPLAHPAVACVLAGARSAGEIDDSAKMLDIKIPPALWEALRAEGLLSASAPCPSDPR